MIFHKSKTTEAEEVKASGQATCLTSGHQSRDCDMYGTTLVITH